MSSPAAGARPFVSDYRAYDRATLGRGAGAELADRNIVTIAVDSGPTDTGWISNDTREARERGWPLGVSSPDDVGRLVRRFAGEAGRAFNGRVVRTRLGSLPWSKHTG